MFRTWADLSWGCVVIQQRIMYKVPVRGIILRMNVTGRYELLKAPQSTQHGKAAKHVKAQRCALLS